ncbi:MAG: AAA family ATPase [Acutalibacteraceae bacterium]
MKLLSLTLDNFEGTKHFEFCPDGRSVTVKAANGVGKSTLMDAYWWLLTGKNSAQTEKFDIYPVGAPEDVQVSVTGVFQTDGGETLTLGRTYKRNIGRRRGDAESTVRGSKAGFFVNGVPKAQKDFLPVVERYFGGEQKLLMLGMLHHFAVETPWADRRAVLIDLFAPHLDDKDIIDAHEELAPLGGYIGAMTTVADYAQQIKLQRRKVQERLKEIPARIDEAEKSKPSLPPEADAAAIPSLMARKMKLTGTVAALQNGEGAAALRKRIAEQEAKAAEARAAYLRETAGGNDALQRQAAELRRQIAETEAKKEALVRNQSADAAFLEEADLKLRELRQRAREVHDRFFDESESICPTCKREYPPDRIAQLKAEFNERKSNDAQWTKERGIALAAAINEKQARQKSSMREIADCGDRLETLRSHLREVTDSIAAPPAWETTTDARAYAVELDELREQLAHIDSASKEQRAAAQAELDVIEVQLAQINVRTQMQEHLRAIDTRIADLQAKEKKLGVQLAQLDLHLDLTERFVQLQASDIEEKINTAFEGVRWVLFDRQVNGGITPCCRALLLNDRGEYVSYESTNTAHQYNGGLHIIDGLSKASGLRLPVWIDKAESCTTYDRIENQVIRLQVSAEHDEITVEVDDNDR